MVVVMVLMTLMPTMQSPLGVPVVLSPTPGPHSPSPLTMLVTATPPPLPLRRIGSPTAALPEIASASLQFKRVLGAGSFGEVKLCRWSGGHADVAVKANGVLCANTAAIDNERQLLELLLQHPHRNILVVYGICTDAADGKVRLVMAHCVGGSLDKYLRAVRAAGQVRQRVRLSLRRAAGVC